MLLKWICWTFGNKRKFVLFELPFASIHPGRGVAEHSVEFRTVAANAGLNDEAYNSSVFDQLKGVLVA